MLQDLGSRDIEFIEIVREIRSSLLELGGVAGGGYEAVLMQGSGTFAVESIVSSAVPAHGKLLAVINGAYGERIRQIAEVLEIPVEVLRYETDTIPQALDVEAALGRDARITHVAIVHCETTTGIINPVREIGAVVHRNGGVYLVDAMSSFGAIPMNLEEWGIDFLASSANKCIEGVPGFAFILARREPLLACEGQARSLSLDLFGQWRGLETNGQFRFTPPTQALLAFRQALGELKEEGGIKARAARYRANHKTLVAGMREMGFREYLRASDQGYIITSFHYPDHPRFRFDEFYERLNRKGFVIYPGKLTNAQCFRIGNIGRISPQDVRSLLAAIRETLDEIEITLKTCETLVGTTVAPRHRG